MTIFMKQDRMEELVISALEDKVKFMSAVVKSAKGDPRMPKSFLDNVKDITFLVDSIKDGKIRLVRT